MVYPGWMVSVFAQAYPHPRTGLDYRHPLSPSFPSCKKKRVAGQESPEVPSFPRTIHHRGHVGCWLARSPDRGCEVHGALRLQPYHHRRARDAGGREGPAVSRRRHPRRPRCFPTVAPLPRPPPLRIFATLLPQSTKGKIAASQ